MAKKDDKKKTGYEGPPRPGKRSMMPPSNIARIARDNWEAATIARDNAGQPGGRGTGDAGRYYSSSNLERRYNVQASRGEERRMARQAALAKAMKKKSK
jgi:hypothetical protein